MDKSFNEYKSFCHRTNLIFSEAEEVEEPEAATRGVLRNFAKFIGKQLWQSFFFNKVAGLRPATLLKKRLWHSCFPVKFAKFLRTPFLQNASGRLLLKIFEEEEYLKKKNTRTCFKICLIRD